MNWIKIALMVLIGLAVLAAVAWMLLCLLGSPDPDMERRNADVDEYEQDLLERQKDERRR